MASVPSQRALPRTLPATARRLLRTGVGGRTARFVISLGAMLLVYWTYAILVVPRVEPSVDLSARAGPTAEQLAGAKGTVDRRLADLAVLFPADSWELGNPKILESERFTLLLRDYENLGDGRVRIFPCTLILAPEAAAGDRREALRRAIVLQAPQGALLRFDGPLDLRRGKIGRLQGGQLLGAITIHGSGRSDDREDSLLIRSRDVQLSEQQAWTPHPVEFRFGPHFGRGRELLIQFAAAEDGGGPAGPIGGPNVGGIESLEVRHLDILRLEFPAETVASFGEPDGAPPPSAESSAPSSHERVSVEITCRGPFRFDLSERVATFEDRVDVLRAYPEGPSDQLQCELLAVHFATGADADSANSGSGFPALSPERFEARGNPVQIHAPREEVAARGQRLEYDLPTGRIRLEGTEEVFLRQSENEIRAGLLQYVPVEDREVGTVVARGPGWLRGRFAEDDPRFVEARWGDELHVRPQGEEHVISLSGGSELRFREIGALTADEIHFWLRPSEQAVEEDERPQGGGLAPDRMMARREVRLESQQLSGRVDHMEVWFEEEPTGVKRWEAQSGGVALEGHDWPGPSRPTPRQPRPEGMIPTTMRVPADQPSTPAVSSGSPHDGLPAVPPVETGTESSPWRSGGDVPLPAPPESAAPPNASGRATDGKSAQRFEVAGRLLQARVLVGEEESVLAELVLEDAVRFREISGIGTEGLPLLVEGDRLHVTDAHTPEAMVVVVGTPARFEGGEMALTGRTIHLDQGANRLWVPGAGQMDLTADRDFGGQPLEEATRVRIHWQGEMDFDGRTVCFEHRVLATTPNQQVQTEALELTFAQPIHFSDPPSDRQHELMKVACRGGVVLDSRLLDDSGQVALERMEMADAVIQLASGELTAGGPGRLTRVGRGWINRFPGSESPEAPAEVDEDTLSYLAVRFQRSLTGNIHRRQMTFENQVVAVYGPVSDWDEHLNERNPDALGPQGVILTCNRLTVAEMPVAGATEPALEMWAEGNARVEGQTFTAWALQLRYAQNKDQLVLEGDNRTDAELYYQRFIGAPQERVVARRIVYRPSRLRVEDGRLLEIPQFTGTGAWPN